MQAIGGTGGLKIGADFLKNLGPRQVLISRPELGKPPRPVHAGRFHGRDLPYYDAAMGGINFDRHAGGAQCRAAGTVVVLHACCHNPTGYDLTDAQWGEVVAV